MWTVGLSSRGQTDRLGCNTMLIFVPKGFVEVQQSGFADFLILHDPLEASRELKKRNAQSVPDEALPNELADQSLLAKRDDPHFEEAEL